MNEMRKQSSHELAIDARKAAVAQNKQLQCLQEIDARRLDERARDYLMEEDLANRRYEMEMEWIKSASDPEERASRQFEMALRRESRINGPHSLRLGSPDANHSWIDKAFEGLFDDPPPASPPVRDDRSVAIVPDADATSVIERVEEAGPELTDMSLSKPVDRAVCDKSVRRTHVQSIVRDATYLLRRTTLFRSHAEMVVSPERRQSLVLYSPLKEILSKEDDKHEDTTGKVEAAEGSFRRRRFRPWWERYCYRGGSPRTYRKPAPYRDITDQLRIVYLAEALREQGDWYGFTLRLNDDVQAKAKAKQDPADWLFRRLRDRLDATMDRAVPFFMVVEEDNHPRKDLHIHGGVGLGKKDFDRVRVAVKKAAGLWLIKEKPSTDGELELDRAKARANPRQLRASLNPDTEWASYCAKDLQKSSARAAGYGRKNPFVHAFDGWPLRATRALSRQAEALYKLDRDLVIAAGDFALK